MIFIIPQCDNVSVVKSLMEHRYEACDNQSVISLECDGVWSVFWSCDQNKHYFKMDPPSKMYVRM